MDASEDAVEAIDGLKSEAVAEDRSLVHGPGCGKGTDDVDMDMENLFGGNDGGDDDDMESLFGSLDDDTEETSLASPTSFSAATPLPLPLCLPLPLPAYPLPSPALPSSSAAAVPADRNSFCDVSTTLPESNHEEEEDGQRAKQETATEEQQQCNGNGSGNGKGDAAGTAVFLDAYPSGFDNIDLSDFAFDLNLDIGSFANGTGGGAAGSAFAAGAPSSAHADIGLDFGLDADAERQLARELGLRLEVSQAQAEADRAKAGEATPTPSLDMTIDTCFFDATGLAGSTLRAYAAHTPQSVCSASTAATTHNDDQEGHGRRMHDGQGALGSEPDFDFELYPQDVLAAGRAAAPGAVPATAASTPMAVDTDAASDDTVVLYERPRFVPTSASELAEIAHSQSTAQSKAQPKATQPAVQLLSPASEPLSQPSSRQASEEASPAPPTTLLFTSTVLVKPAPAIPMSLLASIPHYLELRPRCPQIPPPKRIDLGLFNVEELLPYVQLHSKLSMAGIQQMLGLDIDVGRIVVGECRRYLADPAHRVAPSGTSDPAALRTLKVALIQSSLLLLKYGENGAHSPQKLQNGVGERWFSRSASLEPRSMHVWPDDSTTLVLLFIQLLYRLTRNNSVCERQRKAAALRKAQKQNTPPHSPCPNDAGPGAKTNSMQAALQPQARQQKRAPRFSSKEASAAKHPRLSPAVEFSLPNSSFSSPGDPLPNSHNHQTPSQPLAAAATAPRAPGRPLQPILAYNSPRVLRDDLIQSASRKPPAAANIRYIVNVVDRSAQRLIPQVVLGHDGPIQSAGYSHLAQQCARILGGQHGAASTCISIMTPLGLEKVSSDADWDRVVCRVHGDVLMDHEVRVLISLGAN